MGPNSSLRIWCETVYAGVQCQVQEQASLCGPGAGHCAVAGPRPCCLQQPSGRFFLDWKLVATHLTLARTPSSPAEEEKLVEILEDLAQGFK
uniref:Uncharacterized protein n=1 Tax=Rousettus aegyptiacus TaxID=9407 RepID=A0A7J8DW05_ROUAE|nr:hypothetical protein HJG63_003854 [Rousettus aegyptiacus]